MTFETPTFNIEEFELRSQLDPYLSSEQSSAVTEVKNRVNGQLDWVAQLLGWSGDNYWKNLARTVSEKRQLLAGSYGVFNSFTLPRVLGASNTGDYVIVKFVEGLKEGQTCYLGEKTATIGQIEEREDTLILYLSDVDPDFYDGFQANAQLKVDSLDNRPAPFVRPEPGVAADTAFSCAAENGSLVLYPYWDRQHTIPYKFNILIPGSRYFFDQPVYFSISNSPYEPFVETKYDPVELRWYIDLPNDVAGGRSGFTGYLVWPYSDRSAQTDVVCEVTLYNWVDPSDWNNYDVLSNFTGAWGNKGGVLPFNLCFDALSINGFDEANSLHLDPIEKSIEFNTLLNLAYYQKTSQRLEEPDYLGDWSAWWNPATGAFSVNPPSVVSCGAWLEVDYRQNPEPIPRATYTYSTVAEFEADAPNIALGGTIRILDVTGLQADGGTYWIQGITAPLPGSGEVILYNQKEGILYEVYQFGFANVAEFAANAPYLPIGTEVRLLDSEGLKPEEPGVYNVINLEYELTLLQSYAVLLTKEYNAESWLLSPSSVLRFIGNTRLYDGTGDPEQGEMWWDFANPDPTTRMAATWVGNAWVAINYFPPLGTDPGVVSFDAVGIYLDGKLIQPGDKVDTEDYTFKFNVDTSAGVFNFSYTPYTLKGKTEFPVVLVADALTSAYRADISSYIFSGLRYYMSPNVLDCETPLRIWRPAFLQAVDYLGQLDRGMYPNALIADQNSGPAGNWSRLLFRLPPSYERNGEKWAKTEMIAQDFTYYGTTVEAERLDCPPSARPPKLYCELTLYPPTVPYDGVIYDEPYIFSSVGTYYSQQDASDYSNSAVYPTPPRVGDDFNPGTLTEYQPLHERIADTVSPPGEGYGEWEGTYTVGFECRGLSGNFDEDVAEGALQPIAPPVWDSSIYRCPPTCEAPAPSYVVDVNQFKVGYAYFASDMSAAEDCFFDIQQEVAWRNPEISARSGYVLPGKNF